MRTVGRFLKDKVHIWTVKKEKERAAEHVKKEKRNSIAALPFSCLTVNRSTAIAHRSQGLHAGRAQMLRSRTAEAAEMSGESKSVSVQAAA